MKFKNETELIDWIYTMQLQNTNGRESHNEMFKKGIEATVTELCELKLLNLHGVNNRASKLAEKLNWQLYNRPSTIDETGRLDIEADSKLVVGIMEKFFIEHGC